MKDDIGNLQLVQRTNRIKVLNYIRKHGPSTRPQIAAELGLSLSSVTNLVDYLLKINIVKETGIQASTNVGRKRTLLTYNPAFYQYICINLEPKSLTAAITDLNGTIKSFKQSQITLDNIQDAASIIYNQISRLAGPLLPKEIVSIGIVISGMVLDNGNYAVSSSLKWETFDLLSELTRQLDIPVVIENVSRAIAILYFDKLQFNDDSDILFFDFTEGIGLVYYSQGVMLNHVIGEIGHTKVANDGLECACGDKGCLEAECSVENILNLCRNKIKLGGCIKLRQISEFKNSLFDYKDVLLASKQGDEDVNRILRQIGDCLGTAVSNMIRIFYPNKIVINENLLLTSDVLYNAVLEAIFSKPFKKLTENLIIERMKIKNDDILRGIALTMSDRIFNVARPGGIIE